MSRKIDEKYKWLCEWNTAECLSHRVNGLKANRRKADGDGKWFRSSQEAQPLREAWVAAEAGMILGNCQIKFTEKVHPDAWFRLKDGREIPIEITERMEEGRKPGEEDFGNPTQTSNEYLEEIELNHEEWLGQLIEKKISIERKYEPGTILLVYHNVLLFEFDNEDYKKVSSEIEEVARKRGEMIIGTLVLYRVDGKSPLFGESALQMLRV